MSRARRLNTRQILLKLSLLGLALLTLGAGHLHAQSGKSRSGVKPQARTSVAATPRSPAPAPSGTYTLTLTKVRAKRIWFAQIGKRDLAVLSFSVCDVASAVCQNSSVAFKIQNGEVILPTDSTGQPVNLFGPGPIKGDLLVEGNLTVTHPKHFNNVRKAMAVAAGIEGVAVQVVGYAYGNEGLVFVGKFMQRGEAKRAIGDFQTELVKGIGRVACAGGDPLSYSFGNSNKLTSEEVVKYTNSDFKLMSFHRGAQPKTCFREIVYDPIEARLTKK